MAMACRFIMANINIKRSFSALYKSTTALTRVCPSSSSSAQLAIFEEPPTLCERVHHQALARVYGIEQMNELSKEFKDFIQANWKDTWIQPNSSTTDQQVIGGLVDLFTDSFIEYKVEQTREAQALEVKPLKLDTEAMLAMAQLCLCVGDFRHCSEVLWGAARFAVCDFADRIYRELGTDWVFKVNSHTRAERLGYFLVTGKRMPDGRREMTDAWDKAQNCHRNFYRNLFLAKEMEENLGIVAAFVTSLDSMAVDEDAIRRLSDYNEFWKRQEEERKGRYERHEKEKAERQERQKRVQELREKIEQCRKSLKEVKEQMELK